jgi:hypothetical protein
MIKDIKVLPRGAGKTTLAIELHKTLPSSCVVVDSYSEKRRLQHLGVYALQPHELRGLRCDSYIFDDLFFFKEQYQSLPFELPGDHYIFTTIPSNIQRYSPWFQYIYKYYPEQLL